MRTREFRILRLLAGVLVLAVPAGCGADGAAGPPPAGGLVVEASGRAERGLTLTLGARAAGSTSPLPGVAWTAEPADAVQISADGRALLLRAGNVTFRATRGGASASLGVDVAVPPFIVVEADPATGPRTLYRVRLDGTELAALPVGPGESRSPTLANGVLVFVGHRDGNAELYRLPAGGTAAARLTMTSAAEAHPALSADGTRLAFTRMVSGVPKLFTARGDAAAAARAAPAHGDAGSIEATPAWSPTGERIAFMSTAAGRPGLYLLTPATGNIEALRVDARSNVEPAWSPDGRSIAFAAIENGRADLYLLDVATRQERRLTRSPGSDGRPAWLPDGRLVYTSWQGTAPRLHWVDPADPAATVYSVPLALSPAGAAAVR
jgi:hypothetical protein